MTLRPNMSLFCRPPYGKLYTSESREIARAEEISLFRELSQLSRKRNPRKRDGMRVALSTWQKGKEAIMTPAVTLTDLVEIVAEFARSEAELIATVIHLIKSGQVHLQAQPVTPAPAYALA